MGFTVVALVLGVVLGFATGGHLANVNRRRLELTWLLAISAALQVVAEVADVDDSVGLSLVLMSYVGLSAFAFANTRLVGMPVVLVGLLCNVVVITANGGMPVRADGIIAARAAEASELDDLDFGAKRHIEDADDTLTFLGDIVPVRPTQEVVSFGDLILAVGVADVIFRLLKPVELRGRRDDEDDVIDVGRAAGTRRTRHLVDA